VTNGWPRPGSPNTGAAAKATMRRASAKAPPHSTATKKVNGLKVKGEGVAEEIRGIG